MTDNGSFPKFYIKWTSILMVAITEGLDYSLHYTFENCPLMFHKFKYNLKNTYLFVSEHTLIRDDWWASSQSN